MSIKPGTNYTVKSRDTLSGIALQAYGDGSEASWRRIYNANQSEIGDDPDRIIPGQVLCIPGCNVMPGTEYTVRSGDTLSEIALRAYGDGSEASWRKIYNANQLGIGDDPDRIIPGQVLCIPI